MATNINLAGPQNKPQSGVSLDAIVRALDTAKRHVDNFAVGTGDDMSRVWHEQLKPVVDRATQRFENGVGYVLGKVGVSAANTGLRVYYSQDWKTVLKNFTVDYVIPVGIGYAAYWGAKEILNDLPMRGTVFGTMLNYAKALVPFLAWHYVGRILPNSRLNSAVHEINHAQEVIKGAAGQIAEAKKGEKQARERLADFDANLDAKRLEEGITDERLGPMLRRRAQIEAGIGDIEQGIRGHEHIIHHEREELERSRQKFVRADRSLTVPYGALGYGVVNFALKGSPIPIGDVGDLLRWGAVAYYGLTRDLRSAVVRAAERGVYWSVFMYGGLTLASPYIHGIPAVGGLIGDLFDKGRGLISWGIGAYKGIHYYPTAQHVVAAMRARASGGAQQGGGH